MHPGRMEISNPGGLPDGLSLEELGTRAVPRNRLIADMFYRMGYVERLGSGIYRMRSAMAAEHLPAPRFLPTVNAFRVELFSSFVVKATSFTSKDWTWWVGHLSWISSPMLKTNRVVRVSKANGARPLHDPIHHVSRVTEKKVGSGKEL
jgi:hypothetical protein